MIIAVNFPTGWKSYLSIINKLAKIPCKIFFVSYRIVRCTNMAAMHIKRSINKIIMSLLVLILNQSSLESLIKTSSSPLSNIFLFKGKTQRNESSQSLLLAGIRPFSIVLVKLAFNATRNSRKKPKKC